MRLMYVFDTRKKSGYICRVPEFIALLIIRLSGKLDYAETPEGY